VLRFQACDDQRCYPASRGALREGGRVVTYGFHLKCGEGAWLPEVRGVILFASQQN
jgi:hypothetical protein